MERVGPEEWVHTYAHRAHTHDIHALAVRDSTLLSGGVDTKLCTYSTLRDFAQVRFSLFRANYCVLGVVSK